MQVLIKPLLRKGSLKPTSYSPTHGEFENLCFVFVAPMVCMSRTFVYDVVDVNKIVTFFSKLPSHTYAQVTSGLKLYLGRSANPW